MGVKKHISETPLSKSNSVDLYRPPALRHNSSEEATAVAATNETVPETAAAPQTTTTTEIISTTTSVARKRSPGREQASAAAAEAAAATRRERRPDRAVYVPRARRSQTTPPTTTTTTTAAAAMPTPTPTGAAATAPTTCTPQLQPQPLGMPVVNANPSKSDDGNGQQQQQQQHQQAKTKKSRSRRDRGKKTVGKTIEPDTLLVIAPSENQAKQIPTSGLPSDNCDKETMRTKTSKTHKQQQQQSLRIEDAALPRANSNAPTTEDANKCDNEVRELQRASKEINRSNRRIMKQTFVSDVLEIPEKIESAPKTTNVAATAVATAASAASLTPPADSTTEDDDEENEDDWENMFDENGDCLNPKILQELTESVGKCKIELPKMDYSLYHIKQSLLNEEEFPHGERTGASSFCLWVTQLFSPLFRELLSTRHVDIHEAVPKANERKIGSTLVNFVYLLSKSNSVDLYRPPALRHNSSEEATAVAATNETVPETAAAPQTTTTTEIISTTTSVARKRSPGREQASAAAAEAAAATRRERRPDRAVYVPRARRSQTTPPTTTTTTTAAAAMPTPTPTGAAATAPTTCTPQLQPQPLGMPVVNANPSKSDDGNGQQQQQQQHQQAKTKKSRSRRDRGKKTVGKTIEPDTLLVIAPSENQAKQIPTSGLPSDNCDKETMRTKTSKTHKQQQQQSLRIEDAALPRANSNAPTTEDANKCDNEVRELQRASKEINRSNRRIMKQTFVSDVLEIPEKIESAPKTTNVAATAVATAASAASLTPPADSTTEDDDEENEDDWENMFDENGDCLNPKILQELTESVGKCKIELPKMDYSLYHIKQSLLNEEEFPHVLEISNFPVEFKTPDLLMLFSQYKSAGFDIKWVDDTHALAVFSSSRIAAEVLTMGHPFVKLKPLAEATLESRLKAKKAGATSLQPYRQRPETCTALARRLVSGALGVKLPTAPEERENERRVLREAKERKLLAAKQRDEVWES
ncbi:flocculation protein FLO11 [Drosophila hydei]|uniref:Flocculation protein FLO11 n=1 Tax=Drosophila hydei TaxID=7224 RepID=A0A6J2SZB3_DROHY|nr:flocculation protein FLO11 [Drosophila hydei]